LQHNYPLSLSTSTVHSVTHQLCTKVSHKHATNVSLMFHTSSTRGLPLSFGFSRGLDVDLNDACVFYLGPLSTIGKRVNRSDLWIPRREKKKLNSLNAPPHVCSLHYRRARFSATTPYNTLQYNTIQYNTTTDAFVRETHSRDRGSIFCTFVNNTNSRELISQLLLR